MDETVTEPRGLAPLPVSGGTGLLDGADLGDARALLDLMDRDVPLVALR